METRAQRRNFYCCVTFTSFFVCTFFFPSFPQLCVVRDAAWRAGVATNRICGLVLPGAVLRPSVLLTVKAAAPGDAASTRRRRAEEATVRAAVRCGQVV